MTTSVMYVVVGGIFNIKWLEYICSQNSFQNCEIVVVRLFWTSNIQITVPNSNFEALLVMQISLEFY